MEQHCARAVVVASLSVLLALAGCDEPPAAAVDERVSAALSAPGATGVDVIVGLRAERAALASTQDRLLARHAGMLARHRYRGVPAVAAHVAREEMAALATDPDVSYVQFDDPVSGQLGEAVPATGADRVPRELGLTGRNVVVAVIDSGIDSTHPDLRTSLIAQRCFTHGDCPPNHTNTGPSAEDDHGHGSNVSGIVTSDGVVSHPGFAPDAQVVMIKVLDKDNSGYTSDEVAGLDWLLDNLDTLGVSVVNLSMGTTNLYGGVCDAQQPALAAALAPLIARGVAVFASAGNQGSPTGVSAPACNKGVTAVGATYDSDLGREPPDGVKDFQTFFGAIAFARCADATTSSTTITCFSNSGPRVDVVAPGAPITSDYLGGGLSTFWGTSQASPAVAGVAALMRQCRPDISPDEIRYWLRTTGAPVVDAKNGRTYPSLRAFDAVQAACAAGTGDGGASSTGALTGADGGSDAPAGTGGSRWMGTVPSGGGGATVSLDNLDAPGPGGCACALDGRASPRGGAAGVLGAGLALALARWRRRGTRARAKG
jgi:subtilisin family serine protease